MNIDRFRIVHRPSPLTVALLVVIGAVIGAGALALVGLLVGAAG